MIVTLAYLRRQFDEFNHLIFNDQLPTPKLRVGTARRILGSVRYKRLRKPFGKTVYTDFTLTISAFYDLPEDELDDTILHEMVHLFILSHHYHDDSSHGPLFRQMMNDINARFGRHITISHHGTLQQAPTNKPVQNIIAVSLLDNGHWGITRVSPSCVATISKALPKYYRIKEIRWYNSSNPFFNNYPRSRTPKIYKIDRSTLDRELEGAKAKN